VYFVGLVRGRCGDVDRGLLIDPDWSLQTSESQPFTSFNSNILFALNECSIFASRGAVSRKCDPAKHFIAAGFAGNLSIVQTLDLQGILGLLEVWVSATILCSIGGCLIARPLLFEKLENVRCRGGIFVDEPVCESVCSELVAIDICGPCGDASDPGVIVFVICTHVSSAA
jgi:hypothetical protein